MISHQQILDDLRGEFRGAIHVDLPHRHLYATDASPFYLLPHVVVVPLDEDDLRTIVKYAYEHSLPLVPRGAGTGLSGESLGPGLILDLSTHFRQISVGSSTTVRAQCGVVLADLNSELAKTGRRFAPNPESARTCTIGGMIGTNASGPNAFAHGYTRHHVTGLRVVWDNSEATFLTPEEPVGTHPDLDLRTIEIRSQTKALLTRHRERIQLVRPHTPFDRCGYLLHDVLTPEGLNLPRLMVGTEGTLAIVSEAELKTVPLPGGTAVTVFGFQTLNEALRAGLTLRSADGVVSCDVFDQRLLSLARPTLPTNAVIVPQGVVAVLLAEFEAATPEAARHLAADTADRIRFGFAAAPLTEPSAGPQVQESVAQFRRAVVSAAVSFGPTTAQPIPFIEDTAVPGEELVRYVSGLAEILRRVERSAVFHIHPLTGQVQVRPLMDPNQPADRQVMWSLADQVYQLVIAIGGTISSRHGTGLTRTPWVDKQYGNLTPVFTELKRVFDPKNLLNPGKIAAPDPSRPAWPLAERNPVVPDEPQTTNQRPERLPLLVWTEAEREAAVGRCNGCGDCRVRMTPVRMCPTFHATGAEDATPRAQAHLLRLLMARDRGESLPADEIRAIADQCVNCKMCRTECPSRVDVPTLALEVKAAMHAANGLNRDEWVLARIGGLTRFGGMFSTTTNLLLGSRMARWVIEKLLGISRRRMLPQLASRPFLRRASRAGYTTRGGGLPTDAPPSSLRVAYFSDIFANHADPLIGEATVAVLRYHGIEVFVPPRQRASGSAALAQGDLDTARELATRNVRAFADLIRDGFVVLCSEPTAAVTIVQDYPRLLDDADTALVASQTQELTSFLWGMHQAGWLRTDFQRPLNFSLGHHVPCHIKALGEPAGPKLLRLIPGIQVTTIDKSCSGMAGTYGLKATAYEASLRAGKSMLDELNTPAIRFGSTECGPCRMQMQDGSGKRTLHPVQYLAMAYGLLPLIEKKLYRPLGKLVSS